MTDPVLVVGAGPTGLTAALELARLGREVEIVERRAEPSRLSRAVGILPRSLRLLTPSGAAAELIARGVHFTGVTFHDGARPVARIDFPTDLALPPLLGLAQDETEAILARALARNGVQVRYGEAFEGYRENGDALVATVAGREMRVGTLIGADGVGSAVREAAGIRFPGFELPETWSIADVESPDWPEPTRFKGYLLGKGEVCIVAPLAPDRFRVIASEPDALKALPVPMNVTRLRRAASFTISVRRAEAVQRGRVFLAGDAAHCHSPVGGRGMNLGIADAAELARRIVEGTEDDYADARYGQITRTIRMTERGRKMVQTRSTLGRLAFVTLLRGVARVPALRRRVVLQLIADGEDEGTGST